MKRYILLLLLISSVLYAQNKANKSFFWEVNTALNKDSVEYFISYKIPFSQLVFVRDGGVFKAGIKFYIEAQSDSGEILYRGFDERNVTSEFYDETISPDIYLNGLLSFSTEISNISLSPEVELSNLKRTFNLPSKNLEFPNLENSVILNPISVEVVQNEDNSAFKLNNFSGYLPFSDFSYSLIVPVLNIDQDSLVFQLYFDDKFISDWKAPKISKNNMIVELVNNELFLNLDQEEGNTSYFLITDINQSLDEGTYRIQFEDSAESNYTNFDVVWLQKPRSLFNPELAIEIIEYIDKPDVVRELLKEDDEDYPEVLNNYWRKYDKDKTTKFNEMMNEFYTRVDSADIKFSIVRTERGSKTDRGRIYIKFGQPDSVLRTYSATNQIIETWIYEQANRKFYFTDKSGLGDFTLMN
jgi:GWxTD domain-containing protein